MEGNSHRNTCTTRLKLWEGRKHAIGRETMNNLPGHEKGDKANIEDYSGITLHSVVYKDPGKAT